MVGDPKNEYCVAAGGQCYKIADVWANQLKKLKCPECSRILDTECAYQQHYWTVHQRSSSDMAVE